MRDRYGVRMGVGRTGGRWGWPLAAAAVQVAALEVVRRVFVGTARGQLLDTAALEGDPVGPTDIGDLHVDGLVGTVLDATAVLSLAAAGVLIGMIALRQGRVALAAVAALLIVGANVTTQLLKALTARPDLGIEVVRLVAGNSLPSGHTTVAASVAVALVLVVPPSRRSLATLVGAGYAALVGVATVLAGWHRPSDAVAALLVVGAWAAVACLLPAVADRRHPGGPAPRAHRFALAGLVLVGLALLAVAAVAMVLTDRAVSNPVELLGRGRLLVAYAGGAAGIAGTASLVMALVLATVRFLAPLRAAAGSSGRPTPAPPADQRQADDRAYR
jgi:membrane-associated phospholipid phosphatase